MPPEPSAPPEADRLYDLPLEEFTATRAALARDLRRDGRREEAAAVDALRKPTVAAWAANQLARRHRGELDAFLAAAERLRRAQVEGGDVRAATGAERDALARLLKISGEYVPASQAQRVRQTLEAAAVDEGAAAALADARLTHELEPRGFGSLLQGAPPRPRKRRRQPSNVQARRGAGAALAEIRARSEEARRVMREAERAEAQAREEWETARRRLEAAELEATRAAAAAAEAEKRLRET